MNPPDFAKRRRALNLTQPQLAQLFGVTSRAVSQWETGHRPLRGREALALEALENRASRPAGLHRRRHQSFVMKGRNAKEPSLDDEGSKALDPDGRNG